MLFTDDIALTSSTLILSGVTNITIDGQGYQVNGQNARRCISIDSNSEVTILNVVVTKGYAYMGSGVYISSSILTISDCIIKENFAPSYDYSYGYINYYGGTGMYFLGSSAQLARCFISSNYGSQAIMFTKNYGTGVYATSSNLTLTGCTVSDNYAYTSDYGYGDAYGGGLYVESYSTILMYDCSIVGNWAGANSGGMYITGNSSVVNVNCLYSGNRGPSYKDIMVTAGSEFSVYRACAENEFIPREGCTIFRLRWLYF